MPYPSDFYRWETTKIMWNKMEKEERKNIQISSEYGDTSQQQKVQPDPFPVFYLGQQMWSKSLWWLSLMFLSWLVT